MDMRIKLQNTQNRMPGTIKHNTATQVGQKMTTVRPAHVLISHVATRVPLADDDDELGWALP